MELHKLKARLDLLDAMINQMNASAARIQGIKRTVYVLRSFVKNDKAIPSVYGPDSSIAQFSLQ